MPSSWPGDGELRTRVEYVDAVYEGAFRSDGYDVTSPRGLEETLARSQGDRLLDLTGPDGMWWVVGLLSNRDAEGRDEQRETLELVLETIYWRGEGGLG